MRRRTTIAAAVVAVLLALFAAASWRLRTSGLEAASPTPTPSAASVYLALDCDVAAPGIQNNCTLPAGAASTDVGVLLVNRSGSPYPLGAFDAFVNDPSTDRLNPPALSGPIADRNPDFNQGAFPATWVCSPPQADAHIGPPGTAQSRLGCYDSAGSPAVIPDGADLMLAVVHYLVPVAASPGSVSLTFDGDSGMSDFPNVAVRDCNLSNCPGATVNITYPPSGTPTSVATIPPTATPTATATPVVISSTPSSTPTSNFYFTIDCDLTHPGVQTTCSYTLGNASQVDVGFVLVNNGPQPPRPLSSFNFKVKMPDRTRLAPLPSLGNLDGNPDFNDAAIPGDWICSPARSDTGEGGPSAAVSFMSCIEAANFGHGPLLPSGSTLLLGTVHYTVPLAAQPGTLQLSSDFIAAADSNAAPIANCDLPEPCPGARINLLAPPSTPTPTTPPSLLKAPEGSVANGNVLPNVPAANLFLCQTGPCSGPGEGDLVVVEQAFNVHTGDLNGDSVEDGLGAYEFQVEFDNFVIQSVNPSDIVFSPGGAGASRGPCQLGGSTTITSENSVRFGCVTTGQVPGPVGSFDLAKLDLIPAADDVKDTFPGNDNGIPTLIKDNQCELSDVFGHPVQGTVGGAGQLPVCGDLAVTVRILEGDLNLDCTVDVQDESIIAMHYGAFFGSGLYDKWFDLEPKFHDLDIDIKDLQKVFGRDGSTCQKPFPAQTPVVPPFPLVP